MNQTPTIAIIGCGYVGLTTAAILSNSGFQVTALEINPERLNAIKEGRSFFYEAGIDALLQAGLDSGSLTATDSYDEAIPSADIVFSCVGTPDNPDGSSNLQYVFQAAEQAASLLKDGAIFVQKSTVPVGTGEKIEATFAQLGKTISYVSNPEFLREGTAVADTLWFDRIVVGSESSDAAKAILDVYREIEAHRDDVASQAALVAPRTIPEPLYIAMSRNSAELTKVTANAFLALKISFANSIAQLADQTNADVTEVMEAVGADKRIGRAFLNAGRGYGGGCFPKDVSGLILSAKDYNVEMSIMQAASQLNDQMPAYILAKAETALGRPWKDATVAVLGLSFKAGTSDTRRSPGIAMANQLIAGGARVTAYDPQAMHEAKQSLNDQVILCADLNTALEQADCIIIATDWPEFQEAKTVALFEQSSATAIIDAMNIYSPSTFTNSGLAHISVGRP